MERTSIPGETGAFQTFLKMRQPMDAQSYPPAKTLAAGHTYKYPFTFVVPEQLLPQACRHAKKHGHVERAHTLLPPTLGDTITSSNRPNGAGYTTKESGSNKVTRETSKVTRGAGGKKAPVMVPQDYHQQQRQQQQNDLSPAACRISYCVRATLTKKIEGATLTDPTTRRRKKTLGTMFRKVRLVPAVEEEPPLSIPENGVTPDLEYCMRKEKDVRRGWTRSKRGRLVVTAAQPKPIQVHAHSTGEDVVNSVATLQLRFDPADDNRNELPPALNTVSTKLTASTYYSAHPWMDFPSPTKAYSWAQQGRGMYVGSVPLSTRCVASAPWTKHYGGQAAQRRDSLYSTSSMSSGSASGAECCSKPFYTASVVIPISIPKSKRLVPTFHSCLISRVYGLDLNVSYNTGSNGKSLLGHTASLRVPIQVTCPAQGTTLKYEQSPPALADADTEAETDEDVNAFLSSRRISQMQTRMQPPPAYADYRQLPSRRVRCA